MFTKKEIAYMLVTTIILGFAFEVREFSLNGFFYISLLILIIIALNIFAKKITGFYLDAEIEAKPWEVKRYWWTTGSHFKKPFPAGMVMPLITTAITLGYIPWMASLVFDIKPKIYRAAKRHGLYKFTEMTEYHLGLIAASGILVNILLSVLGYFLGYSDFARLNLYYALFNIIPISDLDGNKIFFGNLVLWSFITAIILIGIFFSLFAI